MHEIQLKRLQDELIRVKKLVNDEVERNNQLTEEVANSRMDTAKAVKKTESIDNRYQKLKASIHDLV